MEFQPTHRRGGLFNSEEMKKLGQEKLRQRRIAREKRWRELFGVKPKP